MANKTNQEIDLPETYLTFEFGYDNTIVLPHDEGLHFMAILKKAKTIKGSYNNPKTIIPLKNVRIEFMSEDEYKAWEQAQEMFYRIINEYTINLDL